MRTQLWQRALPACVVAASIAGAQWARSWLGPLDAFAAMRLPPLCPLRLLTGLTCPTCGLGRSLLAAWSGDLAGALHHHPAGPALLVGSLMATLGYAAKPAIALRCARQASLAVASRPALAAGMTAAYAVWGLLR